MTADQCPTSLSLFIEFNQAVRQSGRNQRVKPIDSLDILDVALGQSRENILVSSSYGGVSQVLH